MSLTKDATASTAARPASADARPPVTRVDLLVQGWTLNTSEGRLGFCGVTLIETAGRRLLVDVAQVARRVLILERLSQRGLSPTDIDTVVLTHAHWDHLLNADLFEHAEFVVHKDERHYVRDPHPNDWATPKYTNAIMDRLRVREVREGDQVVPGVSVIETPGHTVGSISLLVDGPDGSVCIAGDALPHARSVFTGLPAIIFDREEHARDSIRKIMAASDVIYPGHDRPFRREPNGHTSYLMQSNVTVFGVVDESMRELRVTLGVEDPAPTWIMPR
jgi:N-acyl homoserine lactone hydrolase